MTLRSSEELDFAGVTDAGDKAGWLMNMFAPGVHSGGTDLEAAGLGVAIWAAVHNPDRQPLLADRSLWTRPARSPPRRSSISTLCSRMRATARPHCGWMHRQGKARI